MRKKTVAWLLAVVLLLATPLPLSAAKDRLQAGAGDAAAWLQNQPEKPLDAGSALVLLRGGWLPQENQTVQTLARELILEAEDGGTAGMKAYDCAVQALFLQAAGLPPATHAGGLLLQVGNAEALAGEGFTAECLSLVVFGTAGIPLPAGATLQPMAAAKAIAATQNEDGGFGTPQSDAETTALALLALAGYSDDTSIAATLAAGQLWQQANTNDLGGFSQNGLESAKATALTMLALDSLGFDPEFIAYDTPSLAEYLLTFQNPDGSFSPVGSDAQAYTLTVLCTAALAACQRYQQQKPAFFNLQDALLLEPASETTGTGTQTLLLAVAAILLLGSLLFTTLRRRARRGKMR